MNQIEDVCKDVEKTINQTIQNTLNKLEEDCEKISDLVDKELELDRYTILYSHCFIPFIKHSIGKKKVGIENNLEKCKEKGVVLKNEGILKYSFCRGYTKLLLL